MCIKPVFSNYVKGSVVFGGFYAKNSLKSIPADSPILGPEITLFIVGSPMLTFHLSVVN